MTDRPADVAMLQDIYARELVAARMLDAPLAAVWRAWSDPAILTRWWGPRGFTNTTEAFAFTPGGEWRVTMHGPDGTDYPNVFTFRLIEEARLIAIDHDSAPAFMLTAIFDAVDGRTKITFRQLFGTREVCEQVKAICIPANEDNLDRLAAALAQGPWR